MLVNYTGAWERLLAFSCCSCVVDCLSLAERSNLWAYTQCSCRNIYFCCITMIYTVKHDTFIYSCRLLLRPDWGSFRCAWVSCRSCMAKPFSPAASKLLLSCAHALMSWGVYPLCWIKRQSHCFKLDGEGQGGGVVLVRLEGSRDGPHLVKSSGGESTKEVKR